MGNVTCIDIFGQDRIVDSKLLKFRPSVYGLIVHDGKILLNRMKQTQKFTLPGGAVDLGEEMESALKREVREECSIEVGIEKFFGFQERFGYYNPLDEAWHVLGFFYLCSPMSLEVTDANNVIDDDSILPEWITMSDLTADQFQLFGDTIIEAIATLL